MQLDMHSKHNREWAMHERKRVDLHLFDHPNGDQAPFVGLIDSQSARG